MSTYELPAGRWSGAVVADAVPGGRTRDAALVVAGALVMAGLAQVAVPMTPVPMTGQTLAVGLVGASLGARRGSAAMVLYLALGCVAPVFADATHGPAQLWGPSGGYLLGFVPAAAAIGLLAQRGDDRRPWTAFLAFVVAQLLVFVPGLVVLHLVVGGCWATSIHSGFVVFIPGGLVKAAVGALLVSSARALVRRVEARD